MDVHVWYVQLFNVFTLVSWYNQKYMYTRKCKGYPWCLHCCVKMQDVSKYSNQFLINCVNFSVQSVSFQRNCCYFIYVRILQPVANCFYHCLMFLSPAHVLWDWGSSTTPGTEDLPTKQQLVWAWPTSARSQFGSVHGGGGQTQHR